MEVECPGAEGDLPQSGQLPPARQRCCTWRAETTTVAPPPREEGADHSGLLSKAEQKSTVLAQIRSILADRQCDAPLVADVALSPNASAVAQGGYFPWQLRLAISVTTGKIQQLVVATHLSSVPAPQFRVWGQDGRQLSVCYPCAWP